MRRPSHREALDDLADLLPCHLPSLLHVLACRACRAEVLARITQELPALGEPTPASTSLGDYDVSFAYLRATALDSHLLEVLADPDLAPDALSEILLVPEKRQVEVLRSRGRLHVRRIADHLLAKSQTAGTPEDAAHFARLVLVLLPLIPVTEGTPSLLPLELRATCYLATAQLEQGDLPGAEASFTQAAGLVADLGPSCAALYCREISLLRRSQGRSVEATALLFHAARLYRDVGDPLSEAGCLAQIGNLYLELGEPFSALPPLTWAYRMTTPEPDPAVWLYATLGLAFAHAALRTPAATRTARELLDEARSYPAFIPHARIDRNLRLLAARVELHIGPPELARRSLDELFDEALAAQDPISAAYAAAAATPALPPGDAAPVLEQRITALEAFADQPLLPSILAALRGLEAHLTEGLPAETASHLAERTLRTIINLRHGGRS